jgi:hypothetical protein
MERFFFFLVASVTCHIFNMLHVAFFMSFDVKKKKKKKNIFTDRERERERERENFTLGVENSQSFSRECL